MEITCVLIQDYVPRNIVNSRMQDTTAMRQVSAIWPEIAFVLIAANAGIDQIVQGVAATCGSRLKMIKCELAACTYLGHAAVAACATIAIPHSFKQGMAHGRGRSVPCQSALHRRLLAS